MPPYPVERLPNGLSVVVIEDATSHQVLINLMVRVGSRYETPGESGISHFVEHLLFRGNEGFADVDALNRAFEDAGSMLNAHTGVEETEYYCVAHPERVAQALDSLARFVRTPTFADIEKEREILLEELSYDYNEQGHLTNLGTLGSQLLWPEHPLGQGVGGVPSTVERLTSSAIGAFHASHYRPDNMVLALAGRIDREQALALAGQYFGGWNPAQPLAGSRPALAPVPGNHGPHLKTVPDADNQFHLQISFHAPGYNHPDEVPLSLLARTLDDGPTSRLQRIIREELALVYHISADHAGYWDTGSFDIATSVRADRLKALMGHLLAVLADFRTHGPTADEVARAKQRHLFDLEFGLDSLNARIDRYAWPLLHSTVRDEDEERRLVRGVSRDHLQALAAALFDRTNLHLVLVGPMDSSLEAWLTEMLGGF